MCRYLRRPATVTIGNAGQAVDSIEQRVELINDESKKRIRLFDIIASGDFKAPMIVFVNTKKACDVLARSLEKEGVFQFR